jgi:hypothetical protein
MSRPRKTDRTVDVHIMLPQSLVLTVELRLYSELQQRIPLGARARFYEEAVRRYLDQLTAMEKEHETQKI